MTTKTTTRPLTLEDGTVVKTGMKLFSVSQKTVYRSYSDIKPNIIKPYSGLVASFIEEYTVVWINEKENSRSFKVKTGAGCEDQFTLRGCDRALKAYDFSSDFTKAVAKAVKAEKEHLKNIEAKVKSSEKELAAKTKELKEEIVKRKKAAKILKSNIAKMPKTLNPCKSC